MKTQDDLGLTFESVATMLGYDPNTVDPSAIEAIECELCDRRREARGRNFEDGPDDDRFEDEYR